MKKNCKIFTFSGFTYLIACFFLIIVIKNCFYNKEKVSDVINDSMLKYYKEYLCVGGMPDAVNTFLQTFLK